MGMRERKASEEPEVSRKGTEGFLAPGVEIGDQEKEPV